ncbi:MAG: LamG domain-containing protein [Sedimentisphaerales bacterium]|nr:LamG domain-containing protein [Sedimentisphaerales bacterium]
MNGLKELFSRSMVIVVALALCVGLGTAGAVEDQFSADLGYSGEIVRGSGTGYNHGSWYYYPNSDWLAQWFYNDRPNADLKKVITVDLTVDVLNQAANGTLEVAVNWTSLDWPGTQGEPPLPARVTSPTDETRYILRQTIIQRTDVRGAQSVSVNFEIEDFCPQWVSIDIRGQNVSIEGRIQHECVDKDSFLPPTGIRDFGDAPEGVVAYPSSGVAGLFPTCVTVGPASWIEHSGGTCCFGEKVDMETDGNGGKCPAYSPDLYDQDEKQVDGDAGLIKPRAFTIKTSGGSTRVVPTNFYVLESMGNACLIAVWDATIDIEVTNNRHQEAYVNILFDWNQDGKWDGSSRCADGVAPEHTIVNFPVPAGYSGPLSALHPPNFKIGPLGGYVWTRFTISDRRVMEGWNGDGVFPDGETEDYLLYIREPLQFCEWTEGDPHKMHWAQLPDRQKTGLNVDMYWTSLADDFRCAQNGPITEIHFWGSFLDDDLPQFSVDSLEFVINIYSNKPADTLTPWSRPGDLLWTAEIPAYSYDFHDLSSTVKRGWYDPASKLYLPENEKRLFQYDICFEDSDKLFVQKQGTIYWIEIQQKHDASADYTFGWETTQQRLQFSDKAVWLHPKYGWMPMTYPNGHDSAGDALDLAFVIVGPEAPDTDFGDAPDPTYPTLSSSSGASHIISDRVYLGSRVDGETDGQPNALATGDDGSGVDDEDGVVFSSLVVGETASVQVTASVQGSLNAWIDWNADGDWDDAGEQVFVDTALSAGANSLTVVVPATAVVGDTYARFRFSTVRGLRYSGPAADGEVEDYMVRIEAGMVPIKPPLEHLKWSQPPIERDPDSKTPIYCGWDQPAYVTRIAATTTATWRLVADDFRCIGDMPVTTIHWWGSYEGWDDEAAPRRKPDSWRIAFWSNVPADSRYQFSRPAKILWLVSVAADRVQEERVGIDQFPHKTTDTTYQYLLELQDREYFKQADFVESATTDRTFWISITAVYTGLPEPDYPWGWKTRPQSWMDAAVKAEVRRTDLQASVTLDVATVQPITDSQLCQQTASYDMAFELATNPEFIKWEQDFTGIRNWPHYEDEQSLAVESAAGATKWTQKPDTSSAGMDVDITTDMPPTWPDAICGDDFQCKTTGPITGITLWGSWYDDTLPSGSAENVKFTLSIREDIPAARSTTGFSMPGRVLWRKEFSKGQFTVESQEGGNQSYYNPANATCELTNHRMVYKYTFKIPSSDAFRQTGTTSQPVVYWLVAQALLIHPPGSVATRFGWKASVDHWNDKAVWGNGAEPFQGSWRELTYPREHPSWTRAIDLAFAIETEEAGAGLTYRRIVADDWRCRGTTPVTGIAWWGSYIGYGYQPCECAQMTAPRKPDYFMLSIWTDVADSTKGFNHPGQRLWEYKAEQFDEVMVGFDKHPEAGELNIKGFEPVYRYSVRLPQANWFRQDGQNDVLWLSVAAVYRESRSIVYPWGWTNHPHSDGDLPGIDLIGHWKLDERTGTTAADSSGNSNTGALMGRPVWMPDGGWLAGALEFAGRNDYVRVERPRGFNLAPNSFSVAAWIYPKETRGRWHAIMEYDRSSLNGNRFGLWLDQEGRLHFRVGQNTWQGPDSLVPNQWYHVAATYDATTRAMDIYVDGQLVATATNQKGFTSPVVATLTIGANGTGADEFFTGLIDDLRVYKVALSEDDILTLAGAGANSDAVAADFSTLATIAAWPWAELFDQTQHSEDMSFVLFTNP